MFPKVCSAASRHASHAVHRIERRVSYLSHLNTECLTKLKKVEINRSTRSQLEAIDNEYRYMIHEQVSSEYAAIAAHAIFWPDNSLEAEDRAKGFQIAGALWSIMRFHETYSVTLPGIALDAALNDTHKRYLIDAFHTTWHILCEQERQQLLTVIRPEVVCQLGLELTVEEQKFSLACAQQHKPQLAWQHVLSLLDYCNSQTGNFNPVNDSMRLWQLCGVDKLAEVTECLRAPLNEALSILSQHKEFIYEGPAYKGLSLANGAGQFRRYWMQPGCHYTSPHWSSATSREEANYASDNPYAIDNSTCDRDTQLTILHTRAVQVHLFNDAHTVQQKEIMLPTKPLLFLSPDEVDQKKFPPNSLNGTIYCTAAEEPL